MKTALALLALSLALPLRSAETATPTIVLIGGEPEYQSTNTLPAFQRYLETNFAFHCRYLERKETNDLPGLEALDRADLVILFLRRMTLPEEQLQRVQTYARSGKPLIGLRTASHAFETWKEFDHEVLGGNYHLHHGNALAATARVNPEAANHPILKGVATEFVTGGSLYKTSPLGSGTTVLLFGSVDAQPAEPMAWTHNFKGARVFYTSLGHPKDFENPAFHRMLVNAVFWTLDRPVPEKTTRRNAGVSGPKQIQLEEFEKRWGEHAVVLDVRRPEEFAAGHVPGAINLSVEDPDFEKKASALDKEKIYLVHCVHGIRSAKACQKLSQMSFKGLFDFSDGFAVWREEGKPIIQN